MTDDSTLKILLLILRGEEPPPSLDEDAWMDLIRTARYQTVAGLLYKATERFPEGYSISEQAMFALMTEVNRIVNRNLKLGVVEKEVLGILRTGGLHPVVMKGSSCAARYPSPELRTGGDIDLYVPEADVSRAERLLKDSGIQCSPKPDSSLDFTLGGCEVELHRRYFDLHVRESVLPQVGTPQAELLMLSAHILKHACGVGVGLRQIIDFALAYKAYTDDYRQLNDLFRRCGLSRWNALLLSFVQDYIDPSAEVPSHVDSGPLLRIVAKGGNFGHFGESRLSCIQRRSPLRRKLDTLRRFISNFRFSLRYAPREVMPFMADLLKENIHLGMRKK